MTLLVEPPVPQGVLAAVRAPLIAFAPTVATSPVLQPLGKLLDLAGEALRTRLFVVEQDGGEAMALRPDFTIAVAEAHIASGADHGRYFYEGPAFQASVPGAGRSVEFLQAGVEAFGPVDDLAMLEVAWRAAQAGGRDDLSVIIGGVGMFKAFLAAMGVVNGVAARLVRAVSDPAALAAELSRAEAELPSVSDGGGRLAALLSGLPETEATAVLEELWRLAGIQPVGGRSAAEIVHRQAERDAALNAPRLSAAQSDLIRRYLAVSDLPARAIGRLHALGAEAGLDWSAALDAWLKGLEGTALPQQAVTLATGFARPFGYYDGMLFEIRSAALGADEPVSAGGRYDGLMARLGGAAGGAVGCMVRPARAWSGAPA